MNKRSISLTDAHLAILCERVEQAGGIFIDESRRLYLKEEMEAHLARRGFAAFADLLEAMEAGEEEIQRLVELCTIQETYFFREPNHFRALRNHIFPALAARHRTHITIWSAGCSTGEECYSIAISVLRSARVLRGTTVRVLGTDVSEEALRKAKLGRYEKNSFRAMNQQDLDRYFRARGKGFEIRDEVRDLCDFRRLNLVDHGQDRFFEGFDVIFCRNVSIYFREKTIRRLNRKLAGTLIEGGYLIFGASETLQHQDPSLSLVEVEGAFLYRKGKAVAPKPKKSDSGTIIRRSRSGRIRLPRPHLPTTASSSRPRKAASLDRIRQLIEEDRLKESETLLSDLRKEPGRAGIEATVLLAALHANREEYAAALDLLNVARRKDALTAEIYVVEGVVFRRRDETPLAVEKFQKACFLAPKVYLPHFFLAETYRAAGQSRKAKREYRNARRLLDKKEPLPVALSPLTAGFSESYIKRVCDRHLH